MAEHASPVLRIATRRSAQATAQAKAVASALTQHSGDPIELVFIETRGDREANAPLHTIGGQGVFVKEVQHAVLDGRADVAVHSAKDLPTAEAEGLTIGAFRPRRSVDDALIGARLDELAHGATVATGSVRRRAQLRQVRPDLAFAELRGNIATRLERVPDGGAIVMAVAALEILELTERIAERLDPARFVPAVGQGCVAVEHRSGDDATARAVAALDDEVTRHAVEVERAYLAELGSGCALPLGACAIGGVLYTFLATDDRVDRQTIALGGGDGDLALARAAARHARRAVGASA
jgi:hydroxymethylbilane synthase